MWPRDELDEVDVARRGVHRRHCPLHFAPVVSAVVDDVNDDLPEKLGTRPRPWPGIPHTSGKARFRRRAHKADQALIFSLPVGTPRSDVREIVRGELLEGYAPLHADGPPVPLGVHYVNQGPQNASPTQWGSSAQLIAGEAVQAPEHPVARPLVVQNEREQEVRVHG